MRVAFRVLLALLPLLLTPALGYLLAEGYLNFGGGEKDILLVLPWGFSSLVYGVSCFYLWRRGWPLGRMIVCSKIIAITCLILVGLALAFVGHLGIGGRF